MHTYMCLCVRMCVYMFIMHTRTRSDCHRTYLLHRCWLLIFNELNFRQEEVTTEDLRNQSLYS